MSKKIVLRVTIDAEKDKRRVMKAVAGTEGVDSLAFDSKGEKITVIGDADPVCLTNKLRKIVWTELLNVGPAKEPEKKSEEKKPEEKKPEEKKPDEKKEEKKEEKKDEKKEEKKAEATKANPEPNVTYVYVPNSCDRCRGYSYAWNHDNPNACCIQ